MNLACFYHVYAAGQWRDPLAEHLHALQVSGFDGPFHVGIVGSPAQGAEVAAELAAIRPPESVTAAPSGFEQVTLHALHAHAQTHDGVTLYAHTKGAHHPTQVNAAWRRSMTHHLVAGWRLALVALDSDPAVHAVGCHWLTPERYPGLVAGPMFGGNFWMARTDYLRGLAPCAEGRRHDAEGWIGTGNPRVLDLTPGWPGHFQPVRYGRLVAGR